jgi:signal transduction histidine kinase
VAPEAGVTIERANQLEALYDISVELSALRSVQEVLDTALAHCLELTASEFGFIGLVDEVEASLEIVAIRGFHPSAEFYAEHRDIPLRPNLFARVVLEDRSVRVSDARTDPERVGQPGGHPSVVTFLGVPLRFQDRPIGMIGVANRTSEYEDEHERLMGTYAGQVSIVIRNAQLNEALERSNEGLELTVATRTAELNEAKDALARYAAELRSVLTETVEVQERERRRIARDLHDGINQLLIGAMLELKASEERLRADPASGESLSATLDVLRQVEQEVRRVVNDLHPPTLESLGLAPAVKRLAERVEQFFGIRSDIGVIGEERRVSRRTEVAAYRIVQEALQNVANHSGVDRASVVLTFRDDVLTLTIRDDGKGFDLAALEQNAVGRFGLLSMRERVEGLEGTFSIDSTVGVGTSVHVELPTEAP